MKTWSTPVTRAKSAAVPCACCGGTFFQPALDCEGFGFVRCGKCSLVQMNPQPEKGEIIARYSREFGGNYLAYEIENEKAFLKLQLLALKDASFFELEKKLFCAGRGTSGEAAPGEPLIFLDIGCATGALLDCLRERGWQCCGVEISPSAEYARRTRQLDVKDLPLEENKFENESFDVVHASHLIEHLNSPRLFLNEVYRILKKGGNVFLTTPNIGGFQARLFKSRWRSAIFDHLYLFSTLTLSEMLRNAGFKIEKIRTWGGIAAGIAPNWVKKPVDFLAKFFNTGDVMVVRAKKE